MNIDLSDNEIDFLIRAIVSNYGQKSKDYGLDISSRGIGAEIIGKFVILNKKYRAIYSNARKDSEFFEPINNKLFCGSGWLSILHIAHLHKRLESAIDNLCTIQQNGGMGTEYDEQLEFKCRSEIKSIVKEIMFALDVSVKDIAND